MMKRTCKNCRFSFLRHDYAKVRGGVSSTVECRRNAPVCGGTSEHTYTAWPMVLPLYWCGEWSLAEEFADALAEMVRKA